MGTDNQKVILAWNMENLTYGGKVYDGTFRLVSVRTAGGMAYAFQEEVTPGMWQVIMETSKGVLGMPPWMASFCAFVHFIVTTGDMDGGNLDDIPADITITKELEFDA